MHFLNNRSDKRWDGRPDNRWDERSDKRSDKRPDRLFSGSDIAKLVIPLMIELALTLLVGMIDSVMVSSVGEAAVSGVSNGVENGLFQAGKIILASLAASFGTSAITANAVCQTIASIQVIPGSAMQLAATTVVARCIGARDVEQARYYNRLLLLLSYGALAVCCGLLWALLPKILGMYHLSAATEELTTQMVLAHTLGAVLIWSLTFVLPASMRAAGDVRFAMIVSIVSMWVFRVMAAYLFANQLGFGALGVWIAMLCDWLFRAIVFSVRWLSGRWKDFRAI